LFKKQKHAFLRREYVARFLSQYFVWLQPIVFKNCFTLHTASKNIAHGSGVNARLARHRLTITEMAANVNMQRHFRHGKSVLISVSYAEAEGGGFFIPIDMTEAIQY
jgi:hypothetical protein